MPTISYFYGIYIRMYFADHVPPHFHAFYSEHEAQIAIATGELLNGSLPRSALRLVREWTDNNRKLLEQNWERAQRRESLERIAGLDVEQSN